MHTRRHFTASAAALPSALRALAQKPPAHWLFLGTDTGPGIYRARWDPQTGTLGKPQLAVPTDRPDFLALHPTLRILYATNAGTGTQAAVSAFRVDASTGSLTLLNRLQTHGDDPCFVSVDRTGSAAYSANYGGGSLSAFRLGASGELKDLVGVLAYKQPQHGPVTGRQDAAHLHCATLSPGNDFVLACDQGDHLLMAFPVQPDRGAAIQAPMRFAARPGSGPRHVAFHPNGRWLYCIHELDCTVDLYDWTVAGHAPSLTLRVGSTVSTLGPGDPPAVSVQPALARHAPMQSAPDQPSTGCELLVSPDGRFLYTCTRGANTLLTYRIDPATGLLSEHQRLSCGGVTPRAIAFDPARHWLLSCNQGSSTVSVFRHDPATGRLGSASRTFAADTPMFALWL